MKRFRYDTERMKSSETRTRSSYYTYADKLLRTCEVRIYFRFNAYELRSVSFVLEAESPNSHIFAASIRNLKAFAAGMLSGVQYLCV